MRVLQVVGGLKRGGAETMIMNIYRKIDHRKLQFDFLVYEEENTDFKIEIERLGGKVIYMPIKNKLNLIKYFIEFKKIVQKNKGYQGIHCHTNLHSAITLFCAKLLKIEKRICHSHTTQQNNNILKKIYKLLSTSIILWSATDLVACGQDAGNTLFGEEFYKKGSILPNSIDINDFINVSNDEVENIRKELGINGEEIIIGSVSGLKEVKNHKFMLKVAKEMVEQKKDFYLIIVGTGSLYNDIKKEIELLDLKNVILLGERKDIPQLMHTFDLLIMPSLYEGLPVTLVEAQASGICSVISDCITSEVDIGLQLIKKVSLNDSIEKWIENIYLAKTFKNTNSRSEIIKKLQNNGYDIDKSIDRIYNLYNIDK